MEIGRRAYDRLGLEISTIAETTRILKEQDEAAARTRIAAEQEQEAEQVRLAERAQIAADQASAAECERIAAEQTRLAAEQQEAARRELQEKQQPVEAAIRDLLKRRADTVQRFLDIATRHVARKDEYGNEKWQDLPKLIFECIRAIGAKERFTVHLRTSRSYKDGSIEGLNIHDCGTDEPPAKLAWVSGTLPNSYQLCLPGSGLLSIKHNASSGQYEVWKIANGVRKFITSTSDLAGAIRLAEKEVPRDAMTVLRSDAQWRSMRPSAPQIGLLRQLYPELREPFDSDEEFAKIMAIKYNKGTVSAMISRRLSRRG